MTTETIIARVNAAMAPCEGQTPRNLELSALRDDLAAQVRKQAASSRGYAVLLPVRPTDNTDRAAQAQASANSEAYYAEDRERLENGRSAYRDFDPDAFAAIADYLARKDRPTQNAEGVHVGDLFFASWGWEQTNIDYFQVVALKGAHTAVLRQIGRDYIGGFGYSGKCRPMRDHFIDDVQYTVRTKKSGYYKDSRVEIKAPHISGGHLLNATSDFDEHDYSAYA